MHTRLFATLAVALCLPALGSCGAVAGRVIEYDTHGHAFFSGARLDSHLTLVMLGIDRNDSKVPPPWWMGALSVVDFLPSMAVDIIMIPVDSIVWAATGFNANTTDTNWL